MAGAAKASQRRVIVIFDSRYGNTEKIARSFEAGLKQAGVETLCIRESEVKLDSLKQYDLIAVGAPTEKFTASKIIKEF
ncbi:MAG: flavodoxin family protein, partial [Nitrososphaerota archaeon]|nr:flavodoxin family protein [Nitrososphaerota archaeon]